MTFDLTGAAVWHEVVGDPASAVLTPVVLLALSSHLGHTHQLPEAA
jgi:hypothetical protein